MRINAATRLHSTLKKEKLLPKQVKLIKAKTQVRALELPKFRYVDDVSRFLTSLATEIRSTAKLATVYQKELAYLKRPKDWVQAGLVQAASVQQIKGGRGVLEPKLMKVVVPNVHKLQQQYALSEELYQKYRTLESVETQIALQFPDRGGSAYTRMSECLKDLKLSAASTLKGILSFLNEVAEQHVPQMFLKFTKTVWQEVQKQVTCEHAKSFLYVSTNAESQLVFTNYLMLINAVNDNQGVIPHLYIAIQWVVGSTVTVQINPEYELPFNLFKSGTPVTSVSNAVRTISDILATEDFST